MKKKITFHHSRITPVLRAKACLDKVGHGKALLNVILEERALDEQYMLIWMGDEMLLEENYESWLLMRDGKITCLPSNGLKQT